MSFDPYDPAVVEDPYPAYARLRAESPLLFDEKWGLTFLARHADVGAVLRDRRFGRDPRPTVPAERIDAELFRRTYPPELPRWTELVRESFIDLEPPRHTRIRRLVQAAFSRRAAETYRRRLEQVSSTAVDQALESGERIEAIGALATPVPLTMIAELIGVPADDHQLLIEWSHAIVRVFDQACTPEEARAAEAAVTTFADYVGVMIEERRRHRRDDLTSHLVDAELDGDRLSDTELVATVILTLNAGHEATVQAIGNALLALADAPDQYRRLAEQPDLMGTAVEELLRYDTPLQMFERWVLDDLDWQGTTLTQGTKVGLLFGSANRDEAVFDAPDHLDVSRTPNPHVSFGGGVHFCVGAPLARLELAVVLTTLTDRVAALEAAGPAGSRTPSLVFRGVPRLPLRLTPR